MSKQEIDYSEIPGSVAAPTESDWEAPAHKFFGKKLPSGKMEKEPLYQYQEYPRMLYAQKEEGGVKARIVNDDAARDDLLSKGWKKTPAEFGIIGAPSFDEHLMLRDREAEEIKEALISELPSVEMVTAQLEKIHTQAAKKRGRPAKV